MTDVLYYLSGFGVFVMSLIFLSRYDSRKRNVGILKLNIKGRGLTDCANLTDHLDLNRLMKWYEKCLTQKNRSLKQAKRRVTALNIIAVLILVSTPPALTIMNLDVGPVPGLLVIIGAILGVYMLYAKSSTDKEILNFFRDTTYKELHKETFHELWTLAEDIKTRMGLSGYELKLFFIPMNSYSPSVAEKQNTIELYFPRNFLALLHENISIAEPIFIHEMAHIKHQDQQSSLFLEVYNKKMKWPFLFIIGAYAISALMSFYYVTPFGYSFVSISAMVIVTTTFNAGKDAEYLADTAVLLYSDPQSFVNYINAYSNNGSLFGKHPSVKQRVRNLNHLMARYGKKDLDDRNTAQNTTTAISEY